MRQGRLYAVVGASGVGKDTVMRAVAEARPAVLWVRRVITRPAKDGDEPFEPVSDTVFDQRLKNGQFALHWSAHGLRYGVPATVCDALVEGQDAMVNLSRAVLLDADAVFADFQVLNITARSDVRAARLSARGRETAEDIARRLARVVPAFAPSLTVTDIDNSGALDRSVTACLQAMDRETV